MAIVTLRGEGAVKCARTERPGSITLRARGLVRNPYLDWLDTQLVPSCSFRFCGRGERQQGSEPAILEGERGGGVMRVAPVGRFRTLTSEQAFDRAARRRRNR
jgi:hypothetical protein